MNSIKKSIAILGCGNLVKSTFTSIINENKYDIFVRNSNNENTNEIANKLNIHAAKNTNDIFKKDLTILGIKPQTLDIISKEAKTVEGDLLSTLAMTKINQLKQTLNIKGQIARIMPMIASEFSEGLTGIYFEENATKDFKEDIRNFAKMSGDYIEYTDEKLIEGHTILCSSMLGILAYFKEKIDEIVLKENNENLTWNIIKNSLITLGNNSGFTELDSETIAHQTYKGLEAMLTKYSTQEIQTLVASKGGTTEAMLNVLKQNQDIIIEFLKNPNENKDNFHTFFADVIQIGLDKAGFSKEKNKKRA